MIMVNVIKIILSEIRARHDTMLLLNAIMCM